MIEKHQEQKSAGDKQAKQITVKSEFIAFELLKLLPLASSNDIGDKLAVYLITKKCGSAFRNRVVD